MDSTVGLGLIEVSAALHGAGPWGVGSFAVGLAACTGLLAWLSAGFVGLQPATARTVARSPLRGAPDAGPQRVALRLAHPPCTCCASAAIKPLVFGRPAPGAVFGGMNHGRNEPRWACTDCGHRFGRPIVALDRFGRPAQEPSPPSVASPAASQPLMPAAMIDALL